VVALALQEQVEPQREIVVQMVEPVAVVVVQVWAILAQVAPEALVVSLFITNVLRNW
jgi:hypothetical protein